MMFSKTLLLALLSLIMYTTTALRLSFTSPTVKRSQVRLFAEREADFIKAVKKSTVGATLLAVGMFAGVMPGHAYVVEAPFNSILVPSFLSKITLPGGFRVSFNCPDNGAPATATVRQNVVPRINKATAGPNLLCNTKQIDVIADTQVLGPIKLITGELTPNLRYSGPVKDTYILGYTADGGKKYNTLGDAQKACSLDPACGGVTQEPYNSGTFTTRRDDPAVKTSLNPSPSKEISWAKIGIPNSADSLPWKININVGDWTISK